MLLEAAAGFLRNGQLELHLIGDGPQRSLLQHVPTAMNAAGDQDRHAVGPLSDRLPSLLRLR